MRQAARRLGLRAAARRAPLRRWASGGGAKKRGWSVRSVVGGAAAGIGLGVGLTGARLYYLSNYSDDDDAIMGAWSDLPLRASSR